MWRIPSSEPGHRAGVCTHKPHSGVVLLMPWKHLEMCSAKIVSPTSQRPAKPRRCVGASSYWSRPTSFERLLKMNKVLATLIAGLFATGAFAASHGGAMNAASAPAAAKPMPAPAVAATPAVAAKPATPAVAATPAAPAMEKKAAPMKKAKKAKKAKKVEAAK